MDFGQLFHNPYLANLPPEVQAQLQQRQAMDMGMALLANSGGQKDGLVAFGDAMRQYRGGQAQQGSQMMEMQKLAESIRLAKEKGAREQAAFQGGGFAAQHQRNQLAEQQRQANMQDKTQRRGQDVRAQTSKDVAAARNSLFGLAGGMPGAAGMPTAMPTSPGEQAKMAFEAAQRNPKPQGGAGPAAEPQQRGASAQQALQREPESGDQVMRMLEAGTLDEPANIYHAKQFVRQALQMNMFGAGDKKRLQDWLAKRGG